MDKKLQLCIENSRSQIDKMLHMLLLKEVLTTEEANVAGIDNVYTKMNYLRKCGWNIMKIDEAYKVIL